MDLTPGLLLTFGSPRQAADLTARYRADGWRTAHVEDRHGGRPAEAHEMAAAAADALASAPAGAEVHLVNYARAATPGAIRRVAQAWDRLQHPATVRRFGPPASAAALFGDKWRTHRALVRWGVPAVPSRLLTAGEVAGLAGSRSGSARRSCGEPECELEPVVVKLLDRTGGVGVTGGVPGPDLAARVAAFAAPAEPVLVARFVTGYEMSVKALVHGGVHPVAVVLKEPTGLPVVHGDWKLKLAVPLRRPGWAYEVVAAVAAGAGTGGFLSVEGIWDTERERFLVSEVANRRTGSFAIADAVSATGRSAPAIRRLLRGVAPAEVDTAEHPLAATIAVRADEAGVEARIARARAAGHVLDVDRDDLAALPGSDRTGVRCRVHLRPSPADRAADRPADRPAERLVAVLHRHFGAAAAQRMRDLVDSAHAIGLDVNATAAVHRAGGRP